MKYINRTNVRLTAIIIAVFIFGGVIGSDITTANINQNNSAIISQYSCEKNANFLITLDNAVPTNYYAISGTSTTTVPCGTLVYGGAINAGGVTGTSFSSVLQNSINALPLGGTISLTTGVYVLTATVTVTQSIVLQSQSLIVGSQIAGCGTCAVQIIGAQTAGTPMLSLTGASITIQGLQLNGNKTSNVVVPGQDCLQINSQATLAYINRDSIVNCPNAGIMHNQGSGLGTGEDIFNNLDVKTNNLNGYLCNSCFDPHINGGNYGSNVGDNIKCTTGTDVKISGVSDFVSTNGNGIVMANCTNVTIIGSSVHNNWKNGILLFKSVVSTVDGNFQTVSSNNVYDNSQIGAGNSVGIFIQGSTGDIAQYNMIIGNNIWDDQGSKTQAYGIEEVFSASNSIVGNNIAPEQTGIIFTTSTSSLITANNGYNPALTTFTAGISSPYTYTNTLNYDVQYFISTANGISAWTCFGITITNLTAGVSSCVLAPNQTMVITWAATAPVFKGVPLNN